MQQNKLRKRGWLELECRHLISCKAGNDYRQIRDQKQWKKIKNENFNITLFLNQEPVEAGKNKFQRLITQFLKWTNGAPILILEPVSRG